MSNARDKANIPALNFSSTGIDDNADATAITIDSSERIGIGNTTPSNYYSNKLVIDCGSASQDGLTIVSESTKDGMVSFADGTSGSNRYSGFILYDHADNEFRIATNGSEKMRILSDGKVGIGTASPSSGANITLSGQGFGTVGADSGSIAFGSNTAHQGRIYQDNATSHFFIENTYSSGEIAFKTNSSERMRIDDLGNVGIGTTSPSTNLDISSGGDATINLKASGQSNGLQLSQLTSDGGSSISATNNNYLKFSTNATERMRIDSSGNVGIGTSSPHSISNLHVADTYANEPMIRIETSDGGNKRLDLYVSGGHGYITATQSAQDLNFATRTNLIFKTNTSSERMRIDSSGDVLIGTTSFSSGSKGKQFENNNNAIALRSGCSVTTTAYHNEFHNPNGAVGSIRTFGTSTSYVTSSDYRLKENVSYDFDATTRLKQLKPARFNFITDADTIVDGFIAHEVSDIVPEAISGEKDAVKEDGTPDYQGIDQSKLVPLLVKTIQELEARITTLETNNP